MKIERKNKVVAFKEIKNKNGTCFNYQGKILMTIVPEYYLDDFYNDNIVALDLEKGELIYESEIDENDLITILNLKIVEE